MKNKDKRIEILSNGIYQNYTEKRKKAFLSGNPEECYQKVINDATGEIVASELNEDYFQMIHEDLIECERVRKCRKEQREKIEDHINFLFEKTKYVLLFVTFNFSDEALKLTPTTRKKKIVRLLSQISEDYILNIDYGKEKEREHYHGIVALKSGSFTEYKNEYNMTKIKELDKYDYGFYDVQKIRTDEPDKKKLARYITKLTMHSIKVKQTYVSVKKGSDYQKQKATIKALKRDARTNRVFKPDYNDLLLASQL